MLLAGEIAGVDTVNLQRLIGGERRNELALAGVGVKGPPVITAFQLLPVKPAIRKRHPAMRTSILQGERVPMAVAAHN